MPSRRPTKLRSRKPHPERVSVARRPPRDEPRDHAWVARTLRRMTLEQKLGQLLMIGAHGEFASAGSPELRDLLRHVEQNHIGGLILALRRGGLGLERSSVYSAAALINVLQSRARIPLLVAGDFERGTAFRLAEGTSFAHLMALAAGGRTEDAYAMGRITALEARAAGAPWVFAPVADVNSEPANPIINVRSFGEDPRRVAAFVAAFVRGVEENGALATAKHFPGHGDTVTDSHMDLPAVPCDRAHLDRVELVPFRAAIAAGVSTIMTGHLAVPALEPDPRLPVTLSQKILTGLLRRRMRFDGLVVTDSLNMAGVAALYSPGEAAVLSMLAGADVLLSPPSPEAAIAALRAAVASGRLPLARVDEAVARILRAKARVGLHRGSRVDLDALSRQIARPEFARAAREIAGRGVTLLRDAEHLLPLDAARPLRVLLVSVAGDPDRYPGEAFEREIAWRVEGLQSLRCDTRFAPAQDLRLPEAETYDVLLLALFVRVADSKGSVGLPPGQVEFVHGLFSQARREAKPVVVACFGSPYLVAQFPEAPAWLASFSNADVSQRAAACALFGQIPVGGRIPVTVPGAVAIGSGLDVPANPMTLAPASPAMNARLAPAWRVLDRAVAGRAFPGAVLAVGYCGALAVHAAGKLSYESRAAAVTPATIYDLASLTKPVVTATLAAMLCESGELDLDAPIGRYLPEWLGGTRDARRARVTARHLLTHTSGLPAHEEFFRRVHSRSELVACAVAAPLARAPQTESVYSDLGFIVLGEILERLAGLRLDLLARRRIFEPLGMSETTFVPPRRLRPRIAPTEDDRSFRKRLLRGEVHDENAFAMDGVAPHAGLFGSAPDIAVFCQMLLNGGIYAHRRLLRPSTLAQFLAPSPLAANARSLGWMAPTPGSSSGRYFSPLSFGHTGFTGTSLWADPEKHLFVVLLANRVHPARDNTQIQQVRPAVHDAVVEALGLAAPDLPLGAAARTV